MKVILLLFILSFTSVYTQVSQQWAARYNGPSNNYEIGLCVAVDASGNVYTAGTEYVANYDFVLIKYDPDGNIIWIRKYNGTGNDADNLRSMILDNSGNIILTGGSLGTGTGKDCVTIKYDPNGNMLWSQRYNGGLDDEGKKLASDNNGNIYVCGYKNRAANNPDYLILKYSPDGIVQWVQSYNSSSNNQDNTSDIKVDQYGNVFVTGSSYTTPDFDFLTIKYNSSGVYKWEKRFHGGSGDDFAFSMAIDGDSNIYVTGKGKGIGTNFDVVTINYSSNGVEKWQKHENGGSNSNDGGNAVALDASGNIIVAGTMSYLFSNEDMALIKYDPDGTRLWISTYSGQGNRNDRLDFVSIDNKGNIYATGTSDSGSIGDLYSFRFDANGNTQWMYIYNGPANGDEETGGITIDEYGQVYLVCTSQGIGTGYDIVTIKNAQTIGITAISTELPRDFSLEQNYPNPFNPTSRFRFSINKSSIVKIEIFNIKGSSCGILIDRFMTPGKYEGVLDASRLSSGVYFYKMTADGHSASRKMIVIK